MNCPQCQGELVHLGAIGDIEWWRCSACGYRVGKLRDEVLPLWMSDLGT